MKENKLISIKQYIQSDKDKLTKIPAGNFYFANIIASLQIRDLDPVIVFGSLLEFEIDEMVDSRYFLSNYVNYYFQQVWGININDDFFVKIDMEELENVEKFKQKIYKEFKYKDNNIQVGLVIDAKNVFYRNDIDLDFWGEDFISHFSILSDFDFEKDTCLLLDVTSVNDSTQEIPVIETLSISTMLSHLKNHKDFIWALDIDNLIEHIVTHSKGQKKL